MARPNGPGPLGKSGGKQGRVKKRRAESALEKETGEDEFFLASDQEDNGAEEDEEIQETAEQKRLRLGEQYASQAPRYTADSKKLQHRLRALLKYTSMPQPRRTSRACARKSLRKVRETLCLPCNGLHHGHACQVFPAASWFHEDALDSIDAKDMPYMIVSWYLHRG